MNINRKLNKKEKDSYTVFRIFMTIGVIFILGVQVAKPESLFSEKNQTTMILLLYVIGMWSD